MISVTTIKDQVDSPLVEFRIDFGVTVEPARLAKLVAKDPNDPDIELEAIAVEETVFQYQNKANGLINVVVHYNADNTAVVITERELARKYTFAMKPEIVGGVTFKVKDF